MAEVEDLLVDGARHATVFIRDLWRRHGARPEDAPIALSAVAPRLDLLFTAVVGASLPLHVALPPARPTTLERLFRSRAFPRHRIALPATDGVRIWLPGTLGSTDLEGTLALYRAMGLQQARRAVRGTARVLLKEDDPLIRDTALLLEARVAEAEVARALPGLVPSLWKLRRAAIEARPPLDAFAPSRRGIERLARALLEEPLDRAPHEGPPETSLELARRQVQAWKLSAAEVRRLGVMPLFRDSWTGELRLPDPSGPKETAVAGEGSEEEAAVRSARMPRRPERRVAAENEDDASPGAWMIQQDPPHEAAEDPFGLQRPVDRDQDTAAEEYGDMVSELPEARMVTGPGRPKEILLTDDPPESRVAVRFDVEKHATLEYQYPEWDYSAGHYRQPGATVRLLEPEAGSEQWVKNTLKQHRSLIDGVRRQFESLRAEPVRLRRQRDGEDIDLDACVENRADLHAGGSAGDGLYQTRRPGRRSLAITLLVDSSGSTDAHIGAHRRVIDVEKEALLLVCVALQGLGEPYSVLSFSGEGPHGVTVRSLKSFDQPYAHDVALRIAALEPDRYTRAGAAIRHGTAQLMQRQAAHRLLLVLSDGKPNDADRYDGRYGVEDTRQSVIEARLQGVFPFCLTIDRQALDYLPRIFGPSGYTLLSTPERLPVVLLDWMKRLIAH